MGGDGAHGGKSANKSLKRFQNLQEIGLARPMPAAPTAPCVHHAPVRARPCDVPSHPRGGGGGGGMGRSDGVGGGDHFPGESREPPCPPMARSRAQCVMTDLRC